MFEIMDMKSWGKIQLIVSVGLVIDECSTKNIMRTVTLIVWV